MPRTTRSTRAPSTRDEQIYFEAWICGRKQCDVAQTYGVSQSRVSQIVKKVRHWRSEHEQRGRFDLDRPRRQVVTHSECRERMERYLEIAMQDYEQSRSPLVTTKEGKREGKAYEEKVIRERKVEVQLLKLAVKLNKELREYEDQMEPMPVYPEPTPVPFEFTGEGIVRNRLNLVREGIYTLAQAEWTTQRCADSHRLAFPSFFTTTEEGEPAIASWVQDELGIGADYSLAHVKQPHLVKKGEAHKAHPAYELFPFVQQLDANRAAAAKQGAALPCAELPKDEPQPEVSEKKREHISASAPPVQPGPRENHPSPSEDPQPPTRLERLLASGRHMTPRERAHLTAYAARMRAAAEGAG